jgi:hypothetical protein
MMCEDAAPFSAWSVLLFVVSAMVRELRRLERWRALTPAEERQLDALIRLEEGLPQVLPFARDRNFLVAAQEPLCTLFEAANAATLAGGVPVIDLLGIDAAVPRGRKWRPLPVQLGPLLWVGVAELEDALRAIVCGAIPSLRPERQRQLGLLSLLKGNLARLVELDAEDPRSARAAARVREGFAAVEAAIGAEMPAILREAKAAEGSHPSRLQ